MANKWTFELSEKEQYQVWAIIAWFNPSVVTSTLVRKFAVKRESRKKFDAKYERAIEDRIIDLGKWLERYREREAEKAAFESQEQTTK